ncbi:MAG: hypothetical protein RDU89_11575 [bacterium]|nr:hypothetical protein [bacterium]
MARISYRQLYYYVRTTGVITPAGNCEDHNSFDMLNVIEAKVTKVLMDRGVVIRDLKSLIRVIARDLPRFREPHEDLIMVTDGYSAAFIGRAQDMVEGLKSFFRDHKKVFTVPIGDLWQEARKEACALRGTSEGLSITRRSPCPLTGLFDQCTTTLSGGSNHERGG